eukprot:CAMPEP_0183523322 /NCGR_PEP_ID=MMETSP0371-20130417/19087_1 /TAXON_ID=268820 /ORGANISM="Peridinium aciculiferum, Strain PAER-2" /LENGTH=109 /DNA_ID=CAMNT_0025722241 /DNA_START=330 /DNA_END=656 /DNA_ORIENTATION=-
MPRRHRNNSKHDASKLGEVQVRRAPDIKPVVAARMETQALRWATASCRMLLARKQLAQQQPAGTDGATPATAGSRPATRGSPPGAAPAPAAARRSRAGAPLCTPTTPPP